LDENRGIVIPAWMAGIQIRRMRPETSILTWIPALHAGMTPWRFCLKLTEVLRPAVSTKLKKDAKDSGGQRKSKRSQCIRRIITIPAA
jgi:hypothetical protein